jgi:phosphatidylglycerophosphate synthase
MKQTTHTEGVFDRSLRTTKECWLGPMAGLVGRGFSPTSLTILSLLMCVGAGGAASQGFRPLAVALWLVGRLFDGLDGIVARQRDLQSDLGGYLDMMADTVGYAAVPFGVAFAQQDEHVWMLCAALLGMFYINNTSWTYLAAIAEKQKNGATAQGEHTTIHMPTGFIEGAETIVFFTLFLAVPRWASWWFGIMATLVGATVIQRLVWARRAL